MPVSSKDITRLQAQQIQHLYEKHQQSPQPYAEQITEEDVGLAILLEPNWTARSEGDPEYPAEWVTKKMSLATVLQDFRVKGEELAHERNHQEEVHKASKPLRSCLKKPAAAGIKPDKKDSWGSSMDTIRSKDGMNFEKALQGSRKQMVRLETRRMKWKEKAFMREAPGHGTDNNNQIMADSDESLALLDGVTAGKRCASGYRKGTTGEGGLLEP
ncbi:hypothetical protein ACHAPJ_009644 [Fusarium lateritium]